MPRDSIIHDPDTPVYESRRMSANDLALWGIEDVAYIKPVIVDGMESYAIHAADGTELTVIEERDIAFATVRQNDLEPVSVH